MLNQKIFIDIQDALNLVNLTHHCREIFNNIINSFIDLNKAANKAVLKIACFQTIIGEMTIIADENYLYLLEFLDKGKLGQEIEKIQSETNSIIIPGVSKITTLVLDQLIAYLAGGLKNFDIALHITGSPFQKLVWQELMQIPYGQTKTYAMQAKDMGRDRAYRAVANANGANRFVIVVPCHRVIASDGKIGGYSSGVMRKQWLLSHEKHYISQ